MSDDRLNSIFGAGDSVTGDTNEEAQASAKAWLDRINAKYTGKERDIERRKLIQTLSQALVQYGAAREGEKTGVDMSGLQMKGTDYASEQERLDKQRVREESVVSGELARKYQGIDAAQRRKERLEDIDAATERQIETEKRGEQRQIRAEGRAAARDKSKKEELFGDALTAYSDKYPQLKDRDIKNMAQLKLAVEEYQLTDLRSFYPEMPENVNTLSIAEEWIKKEKGDRAWKQSQDKITLSREKIASKKEEMTKQEADRLNMNKVQYRSFDKALEKVGTHMTEANAAVVETRSTIERLKRGEEVSDAELNMLAVQVGKASGNVGVQTEKDFQRVWTGQLGTMLWRIYQARVHGRTDNVDRDNFRSILKHMNEKKLMGAEAFKKEYADFAVRKLGAEYAKKYPHHVKDIYYRFGVDAPQKPVKANTEDARKNALDNYGVTK
jgi:hypothetical protein